MSQPEPLLSICIITFNHENYIRQAIDSVLMQNVNFPYQIIIADDNSTDSTREILKEYEDKYKQTIKLILQPQNKGAVKNWLDLIEYPKSKYIAYLEGDDYWTDPDKLQLQVDFLENNADYSCHYFNCIYSNTQLPFYEDNETFHFNSSIAGGKFGPTLSIVFRRSIFSKINLTKYFEGNIIGDWPLELLALMSGKGYRDKRICGVYRVTDNGAISTIKNKYSNPKVMSRYIFFKNYVYKKSYRELGYKKISLTLFFKFSLKNYKYNENYKLRHLFLDFGLIGSRFIF